ncbi:Mut7-C ubiquitin/RNAse domain-containing protein [Massilia oculi]|uniref:Mut7-C ubiquitin/RNAse domain-containing protein n=1 Tax=Massilia hydrophila TaxID=3044279 RepID=A0ABS7Y941_9BURK|nr:Mut7-C ubiquitin/RNAse domain-containing protein [Massilia oculi]MCA1856218.1 Mut7-C ubiquitin/RNAse domain-containing protein [Massilia oculi]
MVNAPVTVRFRFHGALADFLPRARRGTEFGAACARDATVKHMVEALGVPHTEVGQLLLNGAPGSLGALLRDGDRVDVHPASSLAAGAACAPGGRPRFVADAHLGGLARLLRMAGYDTLYDNGYRDEDIARIAHEEERVLLTRDRELLKRRSVDCGCYLRATVPERQLRELFARLNLAPRMRPFSLCLHCNAPLRPVPKDAVLARLPPRVAEAHDAFTTCDACRRVYWAGSHHARMCVLLAELADVALAPAAVEWAPARAPSASDPQQSSQR